MTNYLNALLDNISLLKDNWDSYGSSSIDKSLIDKARLFINLLSTKYSAIELVSLMPTFIAPICNGTLQLEWEAYPVVIEVEFTSCDYLYLVRVCKEDMPTYIKGTLSSEEELISLLETYLLKTS